MSTDLNPGKTEISLDDPRVATLAKIAQAHVDAIGRGFDLDLPTAALDSCIAVGIDFFDPEQDAEYIALVNAVVQYKERSLTEEA